MPYMPLSVFSWGYYGWGNAADKFVELVDQVEAERGFRPPIFADIRISRKVRAAGFREGNFERLVGKERYRWFKGLGNRSIVDRQTQSIRIDDPGAAEELLDLLLLAAEQNRRVIYFCGCTLQRVGREISCHRWQVGSLLLKAAQNRRLKLETVEWPGGEPAESTQKIDARVMASHVLRERDAAYVPLGESADIGTLASQPWASIVVLTDGCSSHRIISGPVHHVQGKWQINKLLYVGEGANVTEKDRRQSAYVRRHLGKEPRRTKAVATKSPVASSPALAGGLTEAEAVKAIEAVGGVITRSRRRQVEKIELWDPRKILNRDRDSRVKDETLQVLAAFPEVSHLCLFFAQVTDAGLKHLLPLQRLKHLWLNDTFVTDAGMEVVAKLPSLESLWLNGTAVTNAAIRKLKKAPRLTGLRVGDTAINDAGVKLLATMKNLSDLGLAGTSITDEALPYLATMIQLRKLDLRSTAVSAGGIRRLKKRLPKAKISGPN